MQNILKLLGFSSCQSFYQGRQCLLKAIRVGLLKREQVDLAEAEAIDHVEKNIMIARDTYGSRGSGLVVPEDGQLLKVGS